MRLSRLGLVPVVIACAVCACAAPEALATSSSTQIEMATAKGAAYLRSLQQPNGEIAGLGGDWSLTSLAAAGVAAPSIKDGESGIDARTWYRELIANPETWPGFAEAPVTEYERASLVVDAAGVDPARVSQQQNLIAQIVAHYQPASPGYYGEPGLFNGTVLAALALEGAKTTKGAQRLPQALLEESVAVIRGNQHTNGGWNFSKAEGSEKALKSGSEPDMTGAAMAALCGAGVPPSDPAIVKGEEYLKSLLVTATGAFTTSFGANTDSDAWAVDGLNACGIDPQGAQFTTSAGKTPIDFLISQQLGGGAFQYQAGEGEADEYSTQDAVRALAGGGFDPQPPKAKKVKQWVAEKNFSTNPATHALLTLVIDNGTVTPCAVSIAPAATKTKLGQVLQAAETTARPAGCITSFAAVKGKGAITQINGSPNPGEPSWTVSIDGGAAKAAKATTAVRLGDTIYLHLG
jgi:hypothetical protein